MTTFAARLVARHAAPPAIRPRARSRFEPGTALGSGPVPLPGVAESFRTGGHGLADPATRPSDGEPPSATPRSNRLRGARTPVRADEPGSPNVQRPAAGEPATAAPAPPSGPFDPASEAGPAASTRPNPPVADRSRRSQPRSPVAGRAIVPGPLVRLESDRPVAKAEPDVVHVHISRVEIRGALPASEPVRRPAAGAAEAGRHGPLDLERYLTADRRR